MPSRRYWKRFRRPVSPVPNVALVFSDGSWILEPEGTTGSIGDTTTVEQKVIWARPDRVGAAFKDGPGSWVEYDFEAGQELGGIRSAIAQVLWTGQKWLIEWHLPDGGICNAYPARYWGDSITDSLGWSLASNRAYFKAMAVDREGGRAWVAADDNSGVTALHETAISPPGCSVTSWSRGGLHIVGLAYLDGSLYGTDNAQGTFRLSPDGDHVLVWSSTGPWLFASNGYLWNVADVTAGLSWFNPLTGESGFYRDYPDFPRYVVVFG